MQKGGPMKKQVGLWVDHSEALVAFVGNDGDETKRIKSVMEPHVRFSDDQRDRRFASHLDQYYDQVISHIRDADSILIFGPGEAKGELKKRLESKGLGGRIVAVETTDKMTERQIAAKVRAYFQK
jgi:stalled ribosome rescue protein Dom34